MANWNTLFNVAIYAWVLMTNHIRISPTPGRQSSRSQMMQVLGLRYVQYFNRSYKRTGTLWEGHSGHT
ncbi:transposase [Paraglaciecola psychrophila]|uniref:Uncharacterized protein n=1 Tax=Paraglaciecola psychrophila 170 TaxID=1129794 RepID=K7A965_9ALTE|nr:transposase [Paraglaciecola psychrophila]AGH43144.1 hypothetical protein C427_1035 [Paraglaciecola psychrophila 170]GAC38827.1 hypothetical protein GPSY_3216 [Paraglaciecola psychrophila 170]